jgi:hypothetical protein
MDTILATPASCDVHAVICFLTQKDKAQPSIIVDCIVYMVITLSDSCLRVVQKIQGRRGILTKGIVLLNDNARIHTAAQAQML